MQDIKFEGSGLGFCWLLLWTSVLTVITGGLFFLGLILLKDAGFVIIHMLKDEKLNSLALA